MIRTISYILSIIVIGSLLSCKKEAPYAEAGITEVTITFNSPESNATYQTGTEVNIEGLIDANAMMSGWKLQIVNDIGEITECSEDLYEQTQYLFHYHWFPAVSDTGSFTITVSALDKDKDIIGSESIQINCQ